MVRRQGHRVRLEVHAALSGLEPHPAATYSHCHFHLDVGQTTPLLPCDLFCQHGSPDDVIQTTHPRTSQGTGY